MAVVAAIGAAVVIGGGLIAGHQEKQAAKGFSNDAKGRAAEIRHIEANRQAVPNPFANFEDVSSMAKDLP
jgi:outer membrane murein-binding lipoprotein Lpp